MNFYLNAALALSVLLPAALAWFRYTSVNKEYYPFIWLLWISFFVELSGINIIISGYSNVLLYNFYSLIEVLLIILQFHLFGVTRSKKQFRVIILLLIAIWLLETFALNTLYRFNSFFFLISSVFIVIMSLAVISRLVITVRHRLLSHAHFVICLGFTIYFSYNILIEAFWLFGLNQSDLFRLRVLDILSFVNLFVNLLFMRAILWMSTKHRFILQY